MIRIVLFFFFLLAVGLLLLGLNRWIVLMRYPQGSGYLHGRAIVVLVLALVIAFNPFFSTYYLEWIVKLVNMEALKPFWSLVLPHRSEYLRLMLVIMLVLNILTVLFSCIVLAVEKLVRGNRTKFVNTNDCTMAEKFLHFPWTIANMVYVEKDGEDAVLTQKGFTMGLWAKGIKRVFVFLAVTEVLISAVSIIWAPEAFCAKWLIVMKSWNLIPMAGFLIVEQLQWFMEADIDAEAGTFSSENIEEKLRGDMSVLVDLCQNFFRGSKALLYADKGKDPQLLKNGVGSNDLGNRQKNDCDHPDILEMLWNQIKSVGVEQSDYLQNALVEMLNGRSVNVRDHIQGEFMIYLAAYLNYHMSQGRTVLVLCSDEDSAASVCESMKQRLQLLNNICNVWDIQTIEGANIDKPISMLVCTCEEFLDNHIMTKRRDFSDDLFCTVIADGFALFTQEGVRIERLFSELYRARNLEQYVILTDEDNDGLRTAMERYLKKEIRPFNDDERKANSAIMVWSADSTYKLQRILGIGNTRSPHLGAALPVALIAAKYDLPQVYIIPDKQTGTWTFREVLAMSQQEMIQFLESPVNISSIIRYDADEAMRQKDMSMIITYDYSYNIFNTVWNWLKYGPAGGSMLHVISPAYMLRDYFAANFDRLMLKNNEYDALIPINLGMKRSRMEAILVELCCDGLTEAELLEKAKSSGWKYDSVVDMLQDCLKVVLTRDEFHNVFECFHFEEEKKFVVNENHFRCETRVTLTDDNIRKRLLSSMRRAVLVEKGDQERELDVLADNVTNYYLRDQIVAFFGYYYRIHSVKNGRIYGEQCMPSDLPQYYQVSRFVFEPNSWEEKDSCVDSASIDWNLFEVKASRKIYGYWACNNGNALTDHDATTWNSVCDAMHEPVVVTQDRCHVLEINIRKVVTDNQEEKTALLAALMINEIAKTLFPRTWQNLFAVTGFGPQDDFYEQLNGTMDHMAPEDIIRSSIPCAENVRRQNEDVVTVYVLEFSSVEFGMVQSFYENREKVLSLMKEYLEWYLEKDNHKENAAEQKNSFEKMPDVEKEAAATTETAGIVSSKAKEDAETQNSILEKAKAVLERVVQTEKDEPKTNPSVDYRRFLSFGMDELPQIFAPQQLWKICQKNIAKHENVEWTADGVDVSAPINRCTFCGKPALFTIDLQDGRCMCSHCKDHQIQQKDEIKQLFKDTLQLLERDYGIKLRKNIHVRFQSADTIRKATGVMQGGRVLGFYNRGNHQLWIEARGPRICVQSTLIHELTHTWQFDELKLKKMYAKLPGGKEQKDMLQLMILEGHAVYMEIETMRRLHEYEYAQYMHNFTLMRDDEYGKGYKLIADYLKEKEAEGSHMTPYEAMKKLVNGIIDGTVKL